MNYDKLKYSAQERRRHIHKSIGIKGGRIHDRLIICFGLLKHDRRQMEETVENKMVMGAVYHKLIEMRI